MSDKFKNMYKVTHRYAPLWDSLHGFKLVHGKAHQVRAHGDGLLEGCSNPFIIHRLFFLLQTEDNLFLIKKSIMRGDKWWPRTWLPSGKSFVRAWGEGEREDSTAWCNCWSSCLGFSACQLRFPRCQSPVPTLHLWLPAQFLLPIV